MGDEVIPESVLDHLRRIGDPEMGAVLGQGDEEFPEAVRRGGLLRDEVELPQAAVALAQGADPDELDVDMLLHAQRLFATYGTEIAGALLLAALPQAYAASKGSRILAETTELHRNFRARILGTAQFLVVVMQGVENQAAKDLWIPGEDALDRSVMTPWKACLAVRCYHEAIRSQLGARPDGEEPLNQEDLLATLLAFTVTVFEVLERYGITWTADAQWQRKPGGPRRPGSQAAKVGRHPRRPHPHPSAHRGARRGHAPAARGTAAGRDAGLGTRRGARPPQPRWRRHRARLARPPAEAACGHRPVHGSAGRQPDRRPPPAPHGQRGHDARDRELHPDRWPAAARARTVVGWHPRAAAVHCLALMRCRSG